MKNLHDKIFPIVSLAVIFSFIAYLPYAYFTGKTSDAKALGNNVLYKDFTGERFYRLKTEVNHLETDITNMIMNRFPGYDKIVSGLGELDSRFDTDLLSSHIGYIPLKSMDNIFYYDNVANKRYLRLLASPQNPAYASEYYNKYYSVAKAANPDIGMSIFAVPMTWKSDSTEKVPSSYDEFKTFAKFDSHLNSGIHAGILDVSNASLHRQYFFKTDHHWNIRGAYAGYLEICQLLGINSPIQSVEFHRLPSVKFRGSISRTLLSDKYYDTFEYIDIDGLVPPHSYTIKVNGASPDRNFSSVTEYLGQSKGVHGKSPFSNDIYDNVYGKFYHTDVGLIEYDFSRSNANSGRLLLIGDSLSNCIEPLVASHFEKTYVVDQRMYGHENPNWLTSFIKEQNISDILILSSTNGLYCNFPDNIGVRQVK